MTTHELLLRAREARSALAGADTETKNRALKNMAQALLDRTEDILAANRADLEVQLAAGEAVAAWDQAGLCGLLHFQTGRTSSEIRHLAVRADQRRNGLASGLLNAYLIKTGGAKSLVWARQGNGPAEGVYQSRGYRPDGWQSAVLAGGKDETT